MVEVDNQHKTAAAVLFKSISKQPATQTHAHTHHCWLATDFIWHMTHLVCGSSLLWKPWHCQVRWTHLIRTIESTCTIRWSLCSWMNNVCDSVFSKTFKTIQIWVMLSGAGNGGKCSESCFLIFLKEQENGKQGPKGKETEENMNSSCENATKMGGRHSFILMAWLQLPWRFLWLAHMLQTAQNSSSQAQLPSACWCEPKEAVPDPTSYEFRTHCSWHWTTSENCLRKNLIVTVQLANMTWSNFIFFFSWTSKLLSKAKGTNGTNLLHRACFYNMSFSTVPPGKKMNSRASLTILSMQGRKCWQTLKTPD